MRCVLFRSAELSDTGHHHALWQWSLGLKVNTQVTHLVVMFSKNGFEMLMPR